MTMPNLTDEEGKVFLEEDDRHISIGPQLFNCPLEWWHEQALLEPEGHPGSARTDRAKK